MSEPLYILDDLLALIADLDAGVECWEDSEYVEITRWNAAGKSGGNKDEKATAIVRALLREKLGTFPLASVGIATLVRIDAGQPPLDGSDR